MTSLASIAAVFAFILPIAGAGPVLVERKPMETASIEEAAAPVSSKTLSQNASLGGERRAPDRNASASLGALKDGVVFGQIRLQRRVFIRISPRGISNRRNMLAQLPVRTRRYKERKAERCVRIGQIAGVETGHGNRLLLFLEDAEIMSVSLEKACRAKDFYSGFYVDQTEDGKMCAKRDTLQSRNGARCDVERIMELVEIDD
ncbi:MAG: hypothetical protein AAGH57_02045 [Pseudomonadota bacterium]